MDEAIFKFIEDQKLIAMVRVTQVEDTEKVVGAIKKGGIRVIEISETVPNAYKSIEALSKDAELLVGIGNVLNGEDAQRAINSGAKFISCPFTSDEIVSVAKNSNVLVMQGAATPTEAVFAQIDLAAEFIRIFPADLLGGAEYIRRLRSNFSFLKMIPQGGITVENVLDYLKGGSSAVALGGTLVEKSWIRSHDWDQVTARAKQFVEKVESLKVVR
ncbi:MAG: hypothetical protein HZC17_08825 [Candidatus Omnitrophica bacterium]|nr:hypothetical protein [Candidatus Omnitrophota bacterium]